jgi:hypothetical protein
LALAEVIAVPLRTVIFVPAGIVCAAIVPNRAKRAVNLSVFLNIGSS